MKIAGIVIGLLAAAAAAATAGLPALVQESAAKPAPKKTHLAARTETAKPTDQTAKVSRRKGTSGAKGDRAAALANAAIPEADRLAIQSDLAWLGDYAGTAGGDFDDRTIAAIKAYQKRNGGKETGVLNGQERALLAAAARVPEATVGWRVIDDPATGARFGLPSTLVPRTALARNGSRWTSAHGQIEVETFRLHEAALPALFDDEKKTPRHRAVEYSALKPDSFVMSGTQGLKKFIVRVQSSGSELRGITILYDQATEGIMAPVAIAMADTFQGFPDPNAGPPPGLKRGVEYGTAIVVSSRGHLIAVAQVTDQCQSITVAGLGHAERIAEDKTDDLALLRLYGAQDLVAAALAGDGSAADELTLIGIADPLAQAGAGTVARTSAHLTAQGVDPAPKPGFSGAAAIDPQGRFAGMVDLKSPVVAGAAAVSQATLVPAETVRAFLAAQGVPLATGHAAMDQSVVRVICVRK
ncbi:MAG TPA: serine protease [Xanthobacteraceae bacterium]|nr:serine protease [Xanthobacteraceae bacterium]